MIFFFNDTATTEIYTCCHTLSLHDPLPISRRQPRIHRKGRVGRDQIFLECGAHHMWKRLPAVSLRPRRLFRLAGRDRGRSEEHTSELQSLMRISYAVFCLKKKK